MSFLSKIFGKKETKIELSLKQLPKWVVKKTEKRAEEMNNELKVLFEKVKDERKRTFGNLDKLANAELQNPKLITRAKQIMAGNRESYIKKANLFLERVEFPENVSISATKRYLEEYDRAIKELTKTSAKSYYVVSEFFGNEMGAVARNIKTIDDQVKRIIEFTKDKEAEITKINEIKDGVSNIQTSKQQISEIKQKMESLEEEKRSAKKELKKAESKVGSIKRSKAFSDYNKLLNSKQDKQEQLQSLEQDMFTQFSVLDRAMRKYAKITLEEKLVQSYLEKPLESLLQDKELKIFGVLQKMREAIERGELELKDKKKEKTLEQINKLNKQSLSEFREKHKQLLEEIKQTQVLIKKNDANLEIKELEYKVEYLNTRLENMGGKEKQLKEQLENLDVEKLTKEIKQNIKHVFGVEVITSKEG